MIAAKRKAYPSNLDSHPERSALVDPAPCLRAVIITTKHLSFNAETGSTRHRYLRFGSSVTRPILFYILVGRKRLRSNSRLNALDLLTENEEANEEASNETGDELGGAASNSGS